MGNINFKEILEQMSHGILLFETISKRCIFCNPAACELIGHTNEELIGMSIDELLKKESSEKRALIIDELKSKGEITFELFSYRHPKKGLRDVILTIKNVRMEKESAIMLTWKDVSDEKYIEKRFFDHINAIDKSINGISILENNGKFTYLNPSYARIYGYEIEELIGKSWEMLCFPEDLEIANKEVTSKLMKDGFYNGRGVGRKKDGSKLHLAISLTVLENKKLLSYVNDITEVVELEERLARSEKMEAISLLVGMFAHNLNNILMSITGCSELMLFDKEKYDEKTIKLLGNILNCGKDAAKIINDLMIFSQKERLPKGLIDINPIISICLDRRSPKLAEIFNPNQLIDIKVELDNDIPKIMGSITHIKKAVENVVINAIESMEGSGSLIIKTFSQKADVSIKEVPLGNYVVVSISDTGRGISPENWKKIFDPFFSTKELEDGFQNGLGLAVVWGIMRRHKGHVTVQSEVGKGSCFKLYFPI